MADETEADEKNRAETAAVEAELDGMFDAPDAPDVVIPAEARAQVFARAHVGLAQQYWELRLAAEISQQVGDHQNAQANFKAAKKAVERLVALRHVLTTGEPAEVVGRYDDIIGEWKQAVREERAAAAQAATGKPAGGKPAAPAKRGLKAV